MKFRIEYYWADGCNGPDENRIQYHHPHGEIAESVEHAINMIWPQVRENWDHDRDAFLRASFEGDDDGTCYHEYPEHHERGYGCGGFSVIATD